MLTKTPQKQSSEIYLALKSILIERTQFDKFLIYVVKETASKFIINVCKCVE